MSNFPITFDKLMEWFKSVKDVDSNRTVGNHDSRTKNPFSKCYSVNSHDTQLVINYFDWYIRGSITTIPHPLPNWAFQFLLKLEARFDGSADIPVDAAIVALEEVKRNEEE